MTLPHIQHSTSSARLDRIYTIGPRRIETRKQDSRSFRLSTLGARARASVYILLLHRPTTQRWCVSTIMQEQEYDKNEPVKRPNRIKWSKKKRQQPCWTKQVRGRETKNEKTEDEDKKKWKRELNTARGDLAYNISNSLTLARDRQSTAYLMVRMGSGAEREGPLHGTSHISVCILNIIYIIITRYAEIVRASWSWSRIYYNVRKKKTPSRNSEEEEKKERSCWKSVCVYTFNNWKTGRKEVDVLGTFFSVLLSLRSGSDLTSFWKSRFFFISDANAVNKM